MERLPDDLAVLAVANALQVAVLSAGPQSSESAFLHFAQVTQNIPGDLDQPHLSVVRSLLVIHTAHWWATAAPISHELVFRPLCRLMTAPSGQLRGLYVEILAGLRAAWDAASHPHESSQDARVTAALEYVRAHCTDYALRLDDVARAVHVSRWHLERLIRRDTGQCFTWHARRARLEVGCRLLASSTLIIKEVADRVGYSHASEFTRDLKSMFAVTPSEWRRRHS
jgi:AraC-like DNA-binding protein